MAEPISIRPQLGTWVVRAGGAVLGETSNALLLSEANHPDVLYFPRGDLAMAFLEPSDKRSKHPEIGEATHYSIVTKSQTIKNVAMSYESPTGAAAAIAGHVTFCPSDLVTVEQL